MWYIKVSTGMAKKSAGRLWNFKIVKFYLYDSEFGISLQNLVVLKKLRSYSVVFIIII